MSDPNRPDAAVPPPSFPPPSFPPPPAPPGSSGASGSSGQGNGPWVALAVIGVLVLAGVVTGLVLLLAGDDEDGQEGADASSSAAAVTTGSSATGTESGSSTAPTDPTDGPSTPGRPRGTSTADQVADDPSAVVEAFIESVLAGDCATAEDLVTEKYLQEEGGGCDAREIPPSLRDQIEYRLGDATVDGAAGTATVPITVTAYGEAEKTVIELQDVGGRWLISDDGT
ncbi:MULTISPECIES: hypothetical protein [Nocardioides]|uniref:DUF4878 domain-containing protein n=1 Tax=Nocardioides vastitatis TaxID=2568655 RepID=A0ABW0ZLJ6_9ACTN|nr:hypothetical protein [Nocardioides sp.]THI95840.1 hypothetical protein E7Z54_18050 [Nocardioides sp.]